MGLCFEDDCPLCERECCMHSDLSPYKGKKQNLNTRYSFCKHCGQIWLHEKVMGPAGSMEPVLTAIEI